MSKLINEAESWRGGNSWRGGG